MTRLKITFWGTSDNAVPTLERLAASGVFDIVGVITRPDAPTGRHHELTEPPIKQAAKRLGIPVLQPLTLKAPEFKAELMSLEQDIALVVAFGRIIPEALLSIPKFGTLNLHPSLLPTYRGPTPTQAAILSGGDETGVTLMVLDKEMDHGPLLKQEHVRLLGTELRDELEMRLFLIGAEIAIESVPKYVSGDLRPVEQDHSKAVYCGMTDRDSGRIDFAATDAATIERMSRAYEPWPGIWGVWKKDGMEARYKLFDIEVSPTPAVPGTIVFSSDAKDIRIGTVSGSVVVRGIQPEGKRRMTVAEYLNGATADFPLGQFV